MKLRVAIALILALAVGIPSRASAQFFYFGRNKVQYTEFEWHVLKTDHFDIYYYPQMKELAERGAYIAEQTYNLLEVKFNHTLNFRPPLIFYSSHLHFEQTNTTEGFIPEGVGGFFEFAKGRVVIPSDGSLYQFRHVIRHELVHVFMFSKVTRVLMDHRKSSDRVPPLWFSEGLAEYWSTDWDTQAEMVMRDVVLNERVVGLANMDAIYGTFQMYKEGQNALQFLCKTYGDEKILLLLENFWKENSFSEDFKATIGKNFREFDEEWLYALRKQYYPLLADRDAPSKASRRVVQEGYNFKPVVFEQDSLRDVYFIGNRTGYTGIYRKNLDETDPEIISTNVIEGEQTDELEAFHPFRSRIDISAKGILAFVTKSGENDALHLYDVNAGEFVTSLRFRDLVSLGSVSWAPDGKRVVLSAIDEAGNSDLYIVDCESRSLLRLTADYYDDRDPAWSPDGTTIVFSSDRTPFGSQGKYNLFTYDVASGAIDYLTYGPYTCSGPAWSKDGSRIAFTCDIDGVDNVWMMNPHKRFPGGIRTMTRITRFVTSAFDPAWTRSGDLVFAAFEAFSFRIKMLANVQAIADTSTDVRIIDVSDKGAPWMAQSVAGQSELKRLKYQGEYSLDVAQSVISTDPVFGTRGGALVALSDVLGNEQYYFLLYNTAEAQSDFLSSFNLAVSRISLGQRANYSYGIYRFSGRQYDFTQSDEFFFETIYGGYLAVSYPLSMFDRIESAVSISNSDKELEGTLESRKALLLSNSVSYTHDNSLWGACGPIDGTRFNVTLAFTSDVQYSNVNYYSIIADYRNYFRIALRSAFASRFWVFYNDGKESRHFVMGGSWDLRGWPRWSIRGEKLWLTSQELRFPFIDQFTLQFPFGAVGLGPIRGAVYFDAGGAWDNVYTETLGSLGTGLRINLFGALVFRYDIGKRIENNFGSFQQGLFYQFFFGWDF